MASLTTVLGHLHLSVTYAFNLINDVGQLPLLFVEEATSVQSCFTVLKLLVLLNALASLLVSLQQIERLLWYLVIDAVNFGCPRFLMMRQMDPKHSDIEATSLFVLIATAPSFMSLLLVFHN